MYGYWSPEHRFLRFLGLLAGLGAALLMILGMSLFSVLVGVVALFASLSVFRGGTGGSIAMLLIGILTFVVSGGIGGLASVLAIVSGALGLAGG